MASRSAQEQLNEADEASVAQWRIRKLIQSLSKARGNGTSMISLIIPPGEQIARSARLLADEYGTASNIKNRVNRQSVLDAITSTQQKLKLYNKVPETGLVIYCGTILTDDNKEKLVNIDIVPHKAINTSLYKCDNKFNVQCLEELLESDEKYGFVIMDGSGCLWGILSGNTRTIVHKLTVDLPRKHGRGGQSAVRFARLRLEKRHNYLRKVAELSTQLFLTNDRPNVSGIILAGLAEFKNDLSESDLFDQRLKRIILSIVDVSYGGENGFNQAIELSQELLRGVKFIQEKKLITNFFEEIANDTGKYCFGIRDTVAALDAGAVETLLVYEDLEVSRHHLHSPTGEKKTLFLTPEEEEKGNFIKDENGVEWEYEEEKVLLVEWIAQNYHKFGCSLQFVTNKSQEGSQFLKGFGGLGGLLRYRFEFQNLDEPSDNEADEYDFDF